MLNIMRLVITLSIILLYNTLIQYFSISNVGPTLKPRAPFYITFCFYKMPIFSGNANWKRE